jgi:hypothetical protein
MPDSTTTRGEKLVPPLGVGLQTGNLIALLVVSLLGKGAFESQEAATSHVVNAVNEIRMEVADIRRDSANQTAAIKEAQQLKLDLSVLQNKIAMLETQLALAVECAKSKARCRL